MNANFFAVVLLTLSAFVSIGYGLPTGAPTTACKSMTPNHLNYPKVRKLPHLHSVLFRQM
jgi:hypothetical protein